MIDRPLRVVGASPIQPAGLVLMVDLADIPEPHRLDSAPGLESVLRAAADAAGVPVRGIAAEQFTPQGVTVVLVLAESHAAIHTWPEMGAAMVDVFLCGPETMEGRLRREHKARAMAGVILGALGGTVVGWSLQQRSTSRHGPDNTLAPNHTATVGDNLVTDLMAAARDTPVRMATRRDALEQLAAKTRQYVLLQRRYTGLLGDGSTEPDAELLDLVEQDRDSLYTDVERAVDVLMLHDGDRE